MTAINSLNLTVEEAQIILKEFICTSNKIVESESEKKSIRDALLLLASLSEYHNLGICAGTVSEGVLALESYAKALGYEDVINITNLPGIEGSVYIKFNSKNSKSYVEPYLGTYRGVLVSCQSYQYESVNGTYGHLPLDLFV